jgi:Fur family ferric uptake transcriptional regulator
MTRQRRIILEVVCASPYDHLSADEVYERVRRRLPRISLATVYRNLDVLANQGRIRRIGACDPHMRFDGCLDVHFHLRCARCGGLEDAPVNPCSALDDAVREMGALGVFDYRLEFLHVCAACRKKGAKGRGAGVSEISNTRAAGSRGKVPADRVNQPARTGRTGRTVSGGAAKRTKKGNGRTRTGMAGDPSARGAKSKKSARAKKTGSRATRIRGSNR